MASTLLRTSALRTTARAGALKAASKPFSSTFTRGKATLPDLPCVLNLPHHLHLFHL